MVCVKVAHCHEVVADWYQKWPWSLIVVVVVASSLQLYQVLTTEDSLVKY